MTEKALLNVYQRKKFSSSTMKVTYVIVFEIKRLIGRKCQEFGHPKGERQRHARYAFGSI